MPESPKDVGQGLPEGREPVTMTILMDDVPDGEANKAVNEGHAAGDCMRASVATILGLPLDDVPHFAQYIDHPLGTPALWWWSLVGFLHWKGWEIEAYDAIDAPMGWSLVDGYSPRGHRHLCVGHDGEVVFDPHPGREGLRTIVGWWAVWKKEAAVA